MHCIFPVVTSLPNPFVDGNWTLCFVLEVVMILFLSSHYQIAVLQYCLLNYQMEIYPLLSSPRSGL